MSGPHFRIAAPGARLSDSSEILRAVQSHLADPCNDPTIFHPCNCTFSLGLVFFRER